jgi:fructose-1,6-bisphosphatase I
MESVYQHPHHIPKGRNLLLFDPVDGSSNIAENAAIGTIFSIIKRPDEAEGQPDVAEFLQPGTRQVCAGYAIYGPSCMIVITTGNGVNGFTLDPLIGEFVLSHPDMSIADDCSRYFINMAFSHHWDEPVKRYINDCMAGPDGVRDHEFDQRWSGCAVMDVHRVLISGGIYLNPVHARLREEGLAGKLRLLYESNPLAFMVEQAGGLATTGETRVLELQPEVIHQRCPVILGSRNEVNFMLTRYLGQQQMS